MHPSQTSRAASDPFSFLPGTLAVFDGEVAWVDLACGGRVELWRHRGYDERAGIGALVAVSRRWCVLWLRWASGQVWLSVKVTVPAVWQLPPPPGGRPRPHRPVPVDLDTGEGLVWFWDRILIPDTPDSRILGVHSGDRHGLGRRGPRRGAAPAREAIDPGRGAASSEPGGTTAAVTTRRRGSRGGPTPRAPLICGREVS